MEAQTIWTVLRDSAVDVLTACLAVIGRNLAGTRHRWWEAFGAVICIAGKGISA
jgi:hypothetical protein